MKRKSKKIETAEYRVSTYEILAKCLKESGLLNDTKKDSVDSIDLKTYVPIYDRIDVNKA